MDKCSKSPFSHSKVICDHFIWRYWTGALVNSRWPPTRAACRSANKVQTSSNWPPLPALDFCPHELPKLEKPFNPPFNYVAVVLAVAAVTTMMAITEYVIAGLFIFVFMYCNCLYTCQHQMPFRCRLLCPLFLRCACSYAMDSIAYPHRRLAGQKGLRGPVQLLRCFIYPVWSTGWDYLRDIAHRDRSGSRKLFQKHSQ